MRIRIPDEWFGLYLPLLNGHPAFLDIPHRSSTATRYGWNPRLVEERARRMADEDTAKRLISDRPCGYGKKTVLERGNTR